MMNVIWVGLIAIAIPAAILTGNIEGVQEALFSSAGTAVEIVLGLVGIMTFWMGMMRVAEAAGLTERLGRLIEPLMHLLFPKIPHSHPAMTSMMLCISANMLGLGNAATPFGLTAMKHLQALNPSRDTATNEMVMFLAINTASVTLIPTTVLALRSAAGSCDPASVVGAIIVTSVISTAVAVCCARVGAVWTREDHPLF